MVMRYLICCIALVLIVCLSTIGCKSDQSKEEKSTIKTITNYKESHRPQFHFSPAKNWMNDPNGMFYYDGEYHLSYQYYPDSTVWGPMHWGHAISKDLVYWEHMPIALYPDSLGLIFSGGTVVDINNTSGFGSKENLPMVATFTHHNMEGEKAGTNDFQKQSIAYSIDKGRTWQKYEGNPVIPNTQKIKDFRDPKVVWHEASKAWKMVLAAYDRVQFYSSPNLKDWELVSEFGIEGDDRLWECPDLFPIVVEGEDTIKWVLIVSIQKKAPNGGTAASYFVGDFDGKNFLADQTKQKWLDWGADNYAFVTWDNILKDDGRRIGIGWMSNWQYAQIVPTEVWRSAMTIPRKLALHRDGDDFILKSSPVKELKSLRIAEITITPNTIQDRLDLSGDFSPQQCELQLQLDLSSTTARVFGLELSNEIGERVVLSFDREKDSLFVDRTESSKNKFSEEFYRKKHAAPLALQQGNMDLTIFIDEASIELFANEGALNFTDIFFPTKKYTKMSLFSNDGELSLIQGKVYGLKGIWHNEE